MKKFYKQLGIVFVMAFAIMIGCFSNNVFAADATTWNSSDMTSGVTLEDNNLKAIGPTEAHHAYARSTTPCKTSGKWYWEITINSILDGTWDISLGLSSLGVNNITSKGLGMVENTYGYWNNSPLEINGKSTQAMGVTYTTNDTIGFEWDVSAGTLIAYKNNGTLLGTATGIPSSNLVPAISLWNDKCSVTANFGATPFKYSIPQGYEPYDSNIISNSINLNKSTDTLQVGQTHQLIATTTPSGIGVTWKSNDESVATVDSTGKVTAVKEGTATITATTQDGSNLSASCTVNVTNQQTPPVSQGTVLNIEPEKNKIKKTETVSANLTIDNIKDIAAEDVRIKYDSTKLQFLGADEVDGMKLVKSDDKDGELRFIVASKGSANVANAKKTLLKLNFKGIAAGDALVDVTKGRVSDGITTEEDLKDEQCGQSTITIEDNVLKDVNNSGEFTLLDLAIDGRHYGEAPTSLPQYNTDIVGDGAIDDANLLKIGEYMLANPNYKF